MKKRIYELSEGDKPINLYRYEDIEICAHCGSDKVSLMSGDYPYSTEHFQCDVCDSTWNEGADE